jgi:glycosyltransferase involved in cell wall biosynthesis
LKVLHIGKFYPPHMGGIETHLQAICGELHKSTDVSVLVANDHFRTECETIEQVPVCRTGTLLTLASAPICPAMISRIRSSKADLVHIHLPNPTAVVAFLASGHPGPLIISYHSDTVRQKFLGALFEPILHAALRRSSAIIVTSRNYLQTSPILSEYRARCTVIPYGIRTADFESADAGLVNTLRQTYGTRIIVSVGRLVYYKGFEYLIRAMARVSGRLLIVGDGPLRERLQELTVAVGVSDRVVFVGEKQNNELIPYYHAADVFVLASVARSEAFGIVQLEAMASGKPVVNTSLASGVPFVSLHGLSGITVPPRQPDALASALNELLNDPQRRSRYGDGARQRVRQEFSLELMAERTLRLYDAVVRSGARRAYSGAAEQRSRQVSEINVA